jgi:hypothetical protein
MKTTFLILVIFCFSCRSDNKDKLSLQESLINNDSIQKNNTSASLEKYYKQAVLQMVDSLKNRGYKFPTHEEFRNKILAIADKDIDTISTNVIYAIGGDADAIISERFFLPLMELHEDGTLDEIHVTATMEYNKMIMQNNPTDYNFFSDPLY